ncbi:MAG: family 20 glycosylhydrolase [Saprospiraceae bacterium]|nr:family 20 glycosylhydrolase [Saprospiraceae bacterium]
MMKNSKFVVLLILVSLFLFSCKQQPKKIIEVNIIPKPVSLRVEEGFFTISRSTKVYFDQESEEIKNVGEYFINWFEKGSGIKLEISSLPESSIYFTTENAPDSLGDEGYLLDISEDKVIVTAKTATGLFYAVQSIRQLLPPDFEKHNSELKADEYYLPCLKIADKPKFKWRGMLLDCCRHFFDKDFVKRYIDLLAYHKMNTLHWHLTEDQGWRIEIKQYPKLTEIGAWRIEEDSTKYGGFFTQEDIKEVVEYAASRHITVVPEIELPGHSVAALSAYPEYSCSGGPFKVETRWGVFKDIYCAGNDSTFAFLENILDEVIELFPSEYIHIGGDEAPKFRWANCKKCQARIKEEGLKDEHELQSYFITRIEKFLNSKGKKLIGWDEILEGGLAPSATVQSWRGMAGAIAAATSGHDAIVSPTSHAYFDYSVETTSLEKVYSFDPIPDELSTEQAKHIIGGECNVWTEHITYDNIDAMIFPRILAMSEVLWTYPAERDYKEFHSRVKTHYVRLTDLGVKYGFEAQAVIFDIEYLKENAEFKVDITSGQHELEFRYTLDGTEPNIESNLYKEALAIKNSTTIKVIAVNNAEVMEEVFERKIIVHKALGKKIELINTFYKDYAAQGNNNLIDGQKGTISYRDKLWQGYHQKDLIAIVDLEEPTEISSVSIGFLQSMLSWIFMPEQIEILVSDNGENFVSKGIIKNDVDQKTEERIRKDFKLEFDKTTTQFIKIIAKNVGHCPDWHEGAGGEAWLFADEIVVE